jgi:hypothetical protein
MKLVEEEMMDEDEHFLEEGEVQNILCFIFLNKPTDGAINIVTSGDVLNSNSVKGTL